MKNQGVNQAAQLKNVNLIINAAESSWIIGKFARCLQENLEKMGVRTTIGSSFDKDADVNHWMLYPDAWRESKKKKPNREGNGTTSMWITHIDDAVKQLMVRDALQSNVDFGICMSNETRQQVIGLGCAENSVAFVLPGIDGGISARKITIGITTRLYADGRKNEKYLSQLAREADLTPFHFKIIGSGWESIADELRDSGATVTYFTGESEIHSSYYLIQEQVSTFDYYLYLGWDEGSMGTLDALSAGVATIITPQGFHLDLPCGIDLPCRDYADFKRILHDLAVDWSERRTSVEGWNWFNYAQRHKELWEAKLAKEESTFLAIANDPRANRSSASSNKITLSRKWNVMRNTLKSSHVREWIYFSLRRNPKIVNFYRRIRGILGKAKRKLFPS